MSKPVPYELYPIWRDPCGCKVYKHIFGFRLYPCKEHEKKEEKK